MSARPHQWAVVLAGGAGSRFWPLSTPERPKQLLALVDARPLLVNTLDRLAPLNPLARTLVLTGSALAAAVAAALPGLPPENLITEPRPAGTAAALAWAAAEIQRRDGPNAVMMCVHSDWHVGDPQGFRDTLRRAADVASKSHALVTVGIVPTRPDPGFGYIEPGERLTSGARRVARFIEKPSRERAREMQSAGYLWNSGIFVWRVGDFLGEIHRHTPEVAEALTTYGGDTPQPDRFFAGVRSISVDVGVLERSDRVVVLPGDFGWDDVGTWSALHRVREPDAAGNVTSGDAFAVASTSNVVHAEGNAVVLFGVSDLVVVTRPGLTLVTTMDHASDLKTLVESLPDKLRTGA